MSGNNPRSVLPPARLLPLLEHIKQAYVLWHAYHSTLPKIHRYSLGVKIDTLFVEAMETVSTAAFLTPQENIPYVRLAARKVDTLKLLLMILWETESLETKQYIALSEKMDGVGKMLGGWQGQLAKLNPANARGEK